MPLTPYHTYATYEQGHSLEAAAQWVQHLLLGQVGTMIAVLAVAMAGLNMLWGRISAREGARILLGCFILFGAPAIAQGLMGAIEGNAPAISTTPYQPFTAPLPMATTPLPSASINPFDPYTGASTAK